MVHSRVHLYNGVIAADAAGLHFSKQDIIVTHNYV